TPFGRRRGRGDLVGVQRVTCAPSLVSSGTGRNGHEKTPSVAGGVHRVRALRLNQRARPPGTPLGVVVVAVTAIRSMPLISPISRAARAASRYALSASSGDPPHATIDIRSG